MIQLSEYKPLGRITLGTALLLGLIMACGPKGPPRHLTKLQAFRCSKPKQPNCTELLRGEPIPRDSLPPVDEAFQLWAWHPGKGLVEYRAEWKSRFFNDTAAPVAPRQSGTDYKQAGDSTMLSYNFAMAVRTKYVIRVLLVSSRGKIEDQDSLVWDYTNAPSPQPVMDEHELHH